jgi:hypothetical protein
MQQHFQAAAYQDMLQCSKHIPLQHRHHQQALLWTLLQLQQLHVLQLLL